MVLMLWSYIGAYTMLLGAELNAELRAGELATRDEGTREPEAPNADPMPSVHRSEQSDREFTERCGEA